MKEIKRVQLILTEEELNLVKNWFRKTKKNVITEIIKTCDMQNDKIKVLLRKEPRGVVLIATMYFKGKSVIETVKFSNYTELLNVLKFKGEKDNSEIFLKIKESSPKHKREFIPLDFETKNYSKESILNSIKYIDFFKDVELVQALYLYIMCVQIHSKNFYDLDVLMEKKLEVGGCERNHKLEKNPYHMTEEFELLILRVKKDKISEFCVEQLIELAYKVLYNEIAYDELYKTSFYASLFMDKCLELVE